MEKKVVIVASKLAFIWILDFETGQPIYGYENVTVPKSTIPGEWTPETQPFPLPEALRLLPQKFDESNVWGRTPQEREHCLNWAKNFTGGTGEAVYYTPMSVNGTILFPSHVGGPNIPGCTADPIKGTLLCYVRNLAIINKMFPQGQPVPPDQPWLSCLPMIDTPYFFCYNFLWTPNGKLKKLGIYPL